eukprot:13598501-Alexandrium_andersonii.AAC.1
MLKGTHAGRDAKEVKALLQLASVAPNGEAARGEAPLAQALLKRAPLGDRLGHGLEGPGTEPTEA